jgi:hypothetical protein
MGTRMHSDLPRRGSPRCPVASDCSHAVAGGTAAPEPAGLSTMTDFTRVWHRAWVVRDCSHPGFGPPAGGHGATVQRGCSDRGRRVPVLREPGIRVTSSTLTHAPLLPFRPTRTCLSDHRRQQLIGQLTGFTVAVPTPRARALSMNRVPYPTWASRRNPLQGIVAVWGPVSCLCHLCGGGRGVVRFRSRC